MDTKDGLALDAILTAAAGGVAATPEQPSEAAPAGAISARIAAILDTAEEEAEKIRDRARDEAASIIRAAHAAAAERIDELTREPERLRGEAERGAKELLETARSEAAQQVATAEQQARELLRESEQQAEQRRRDAERASAEMEAAMERRKRALNDELAALASLREQAGASVQDVVNVLQRTASDIDRRLGAIPDSESTEREPVADSGKSGLRLLRRGSED